MAKDYWIERFNNEVMPIIREKFKPTKVLLFGSRVKGIAREGSDLDVILVSEAFEDIPFIKRMQIVLKSARFPKHVDYLCYTPEEFERIRYTSSVVQAALEECEEIAI